MPTQQLRVHVANGSNLVAGNEVREGGYRVGVVQDIRPVALNGGAVGAELDLKLDQFAGAVPTDSTVRIRPRSALGLKYVELTRGLSKRTFPDGGVLPESQASYPVELDEVFDTFDQPTRDASRTNLDAFGSALAGRGPDLNRAIEGLPAFAGHLEAVTRNLSDPDTDLRSLFRELGDAARIVAPVSQVNARLFTTMATTFAAISRDEQALKDTIAKGPATLDEGTRSLREQRPFLNNVAAFSRDLNGAAVELRAALPTVNDAIEIGTPVTRRTVALSGRTERVLAAVRDLTAAPSTNAALRGLTATVTTLQPQLRYLGPYVTVCNTWNTFWTFTAEHLSSPDATGTSQRALVNSAPRTNDGVASAGANEFVTGRGQMQSGAKQLLHGNFYPAAVDDSGAADCEAGQQGYAARGNPFDDTPDNFYENAVVEGEFRTGGTRDRAGSGRRLVNSNGSQGPNYKTFDRQGKGHGRNAARVPTGQTFTRNPGGNGALIDP